MVETAIARAARLRRFRANNPGYSSAKNKTWKDANREKYLAHKMVEYALKTGKLIRKPCECGCDRKAQAHHEDYSKPLDVRWLCVRAHKARHVEIDRQNSNSESGGFNSRSLAEIR